MTHSERETSVPDEQELSWCCDSGPGAAMNWYSQLGLGVLLLNTNNFTELYHQIRPLGDHDIPRQK